MCLSRGRLLRHILYVIFIMKIKMNRIKQKGQKMQSSLVPLLAFTNNPYEKFMHADYPQSTGRIWKVSTCRPHVEYEDLHRAHMGTIYTMSTIVCRCNCHSTCGAPVGFGFFLGRTDFFVLHLLTFLKIKSSIYTVAPVFVGPGILSLSFRSERISMESREPRKVTDLTASCHLWLKLKELQQTMTR